ncbi:hypothetical protein EDB85DRAFT_2032379 [Lactarius pseudohatsudake]|nr:hypothetical protein EDB85DRAFT_2032379 [Lactarius pseudohatsudake]
MATPPNPLPVVLPAPPNDPRVQLPHAPLSPPTRDDVLQAVKYHRLVDASMRVVQGPNCTQDDRYNAVIYEHSIVAQAAAAAAPEAVVHPAILNEIHQLHNEIQQFHVDLQNTRAEILPDVKRLINQSRGLGNVVPFEVVPFTDGTDPTLPPHNLPPLYTVNVIDNLSEQSLTTYLTHYGIVPLPTASGGSPDATKHLQKETLKQLVGAHV